uniref:Secreted protein n=1 Tax=Salix viminalis TaxID=40686 RepID=A0A6N2KKJ3_SALVM
MKILLSHRLLIMLGWASEAPKLNGIDQAPPPTLFCLVRVSATECNVFFPILDPVPLYSLVGREGPG